MNLDAVMIAVALLCADLDTPREIQTCQKHLSRCMLEKRSDYPNRDLLQCVAEGRMN